MSATPSGSALPMDVNIQNLLIVDIVHMYTLAHLHMYTLVNVYV